MPTHVITVNISVRIERLAALNVSSREETSITATINFSEGYSMLRYFPDHIWEKYRMESQPSKIQDL